MNFRERLRHLRRQFVLKVHNSGSNVSASSAKELRDEPINPEWIEEGQPKARAAVAVSSADGTLHAGEWDCTAGRFRWIYNEDEMIHILEGQAFIEVDGAPRPCGPGDSIFFPMGQSVRWHVPTYVRKLFFIRKPGRMVEALRTVKILGAILLGPVLSETLLSDSSILMLLG